MAANTWAGDGAQQQLGATCAAGADHVCSGSGGAPSPGAVMTAERPDFKGADTGSDLGRAADTGMLVPG